AGEPAEKTPPCIAAEKRRNLWTTQELSTIAELGLRHKSTNGKVCWTDVSAEWQRRAMPPRTTAALKAAYAKLARRLNNVSGLAVNDVWVPTATSNVDDATSPLTHGMKHPHQSKPTTGHQSQRPVAPPESTPEMSNTGRTVADVQLSSSERNDASTSDDSDGKVESAPSGETAQLQAPTTPNPRADTWRDDLEKTFTRLYRKAQHTRQRRPIQRPKTRIAKRLLQAGDQILRKHFSRGGRRNRTFAAVNAAVYAMGAAIAAAMVRQQKKDKLNNKETLLKQRISEAKDLKSTLIRLISTLANELLRRESIHGHSVPGASKKPSQKYVELRQAFRLTNETSIRTLQRKLKDEYSILCTDLQHLEEQREHLRWKVNGLNLLKKEERQQGDLQIPIEEIRDYWYEIVGQEKPFNKHSEDLNSWAWALKRELGCPAIRDRGDDNEEAERQPQSQVRWNRKLQDADWKRLWSKLRTWKATGPDGIQGQ
ncbi:unnamed protein product, partial [Cylicostephanus goldi]